MEKSHRHITIKESGYTIGWLEKQMELPANTFYNWVNGSKPLPVVHTAIVKKILKKYKINLAV